METSVSSVLWWQRDGQRLGGGEAHRGQNRAGEEDRGTEIHTEKAKQADTQKQAYDSMLSWGGGAWGETWGFGV